MVLAGGLLLPPEHVGVAVVELVVAVAFVVLQALVLADDIRLEKVA